MQNTFPLFTRHIDVTCFHCGVPIGSDNPLTLSLNHPIKYGFPKGTYGMWCDTCKLRTYYDTPDGSISFDSKGNVIETTCSCGCTVPQELWDSSSGWPRCPECDIV